MEWGEGQVLAFGSATRKGTHPALSYSRKSCRSRGPARSDRPAAASAAAAGGGAAAGGEAAAEELVPAPAGGRAMVVVESEERGFDERSGARARGQRRV